ncbi:MAG: hypothetical protein ABSF99_00350 [Anaerolineales bacterium]|jgi:hypothetical protein
MAEITPRERVWQSILHNQTDRVPKHDMPGDIPQENLLAFIYTVRGQE